jgi:four helix bundle protein
MATIKKFEDIEAWQKAKELCQEINRISMETPLYKDYKLREQINGSSGSIMDNIAEGFDRGSRLELINFLTYAKGSSGEVKSQLYRIFDRNYISKEKFEDLYNQTDKIASMLSTWIGYLNRSEIKGSKFKDRN